MLRFGPSVSTAAQTRHVGSGWGQHLHGCADSAYLIDITASEGCRRRGAALVEQGARVGSERGIKASQPNPFGASKFFT